MKILLISLLLVLSSCTYEATCWSEGRIIYQYSERDDHFQNGDSYCPEYRGNGWYKLPYSNHPVKANCKCWISAR